MQIIASVVLSHTASFPLFPANAKLFHTKDPSVGSPAATWGLDGEGTKQIWSLYKGTQTSIDRNYMKQRILCLWQTIKSTTKIERKSCIWEETIESGKTIRSWTEVENISSVIVHCRNDLIWLQSSTCPMNWYDKQSRIICFHNWQHLIP